MDDAAVAVPPSRVRCQRSLSPGLKGTPSAASRSIAAGAFSTTNSTIDRSLRPGARDHCVLDMRRKGVARLQHRGDPACAQAVEPSERPPLASTTTLNAPRG
jgi:hypothetical protein